MQEENRSETVETGKFGLELEQMHITGIEPVTHWCPEAMEDRPTLRWHAF